MAGFNPSAGWLNGLEPEERELALRTMREERNALKRENKAIRRHRSQKLSAWNNPNDALHRQSLERWRNK